MSFQHRFPWNCEPTTTASLARWIARSEPTSIQGESPVLASLMQHLSTEETTGAPRNETQVLQQCSESLPDDIETRIQHELDHRRLPIQQLWLARAPGLWRLIDRWIDQPSFDDRVEVFLSLPFFNGAAGPFDERRAVWIEAVLVDVQPQLPEVLRLTHALLSVALSQSFPSQRSSDRHALAVAMTLLAGEQVELTEWSVPLFRLAHDEWRSPIEKASKAEASAPSSTLDFDAMSADQAQSAVLSEIKKLSKQG